MITAQLFMVMLRDLLDLHGVDVDALDDEHVVRAAENTVHAAMPAPAGAAPGEEAGEVARTVAQDGHTFAAEARHHEFAHLAVRHGLARGGVNDFGDIGVLPDVQAVLRQALEAHARAVHLRKTVGIIGFHGEKVLDTAAELFGIGFGADERDAQGKVPRVFAHAA